MSRALEGDGGYWGGSSTKPTYYESQDQAFEGGVDYANQHDLWASTQGGSESQARASYSDSNSDSGSTKNIVQKQTQGGTHLFKVHDRIAKGRMFYGALLNEYVDVSGYKYSSYQWIQVVNTTPASSVNGILMTNPVIDGTIDSKGKNVNYPFYYTNDENYSYGKYSLFADGPGTTQKNYCFSAETTLVGITDGCVTPLVTYSWGYQVNDGATSLFSFTTSNEPSSITSGIINTYNNK